VEHRAVTPARQRAPKFDRRTVATLVALACGVFVAAYGSSVMPGVIGHLSRETGIPLTDVGRSNALFGAVYAISAPSLGALLRRRDPLRVLTWALPALGLTMVALAGVRTTGELYAARAVQAALASLIVPMSVVHAGSIVPRGSRSRALSVAYTGLVVASLVGAPLGEAVARQFSTAVVFGIGAVLALVSLIGLLVIRPFQAELRSRHEPASGTGTQRAVAGMAAVVIGGVFLAALTESMGTSGLSSYLTPFLEERVGGAGLALSALLLCYGLGGLAGNTVSGLVADRVGPARVIVITHMVAAAAAAALALVGDPWLIGSLLAVWGFASWAINPALQSLLLTYGGSRANVLVAVNSSVIYAGSALGAAAASAAVDGVGLQIVPYAAAFAFLATVFSGVMIALAEARFADRNPAPGHHEAS
jgi:MFS transporter, DHA1 family, inner membrane transport protein